MSSLRTQSNKVSPASKTPIPTQKLMDSNQVLFMQLLSWCRVWDLIMNFWRRECSHSITFFLGYMVEWDDWLIFLSQLLFLYRAVISGTHIMSTSSSPNWYIGQFHNYHTVKLSICFLTSIWTVYYCDVMLRVIVVSTWVTRGKSFIPYIHVYSTSFWEYLWYIHLYYW